MMTHKPHNRRKVRRAQLRLEALEDRCLPAMLAPGYGQLPLAFESNQGQASQGVDFIARGNGYNWSLSAAEAVLAGEPGASPLGGTCLHLQLLGGNASARAIALDPLITRVNYLTGSDPSQWHTNIPTFGEVQYDNVYRGIDVSYHGNQGRLEYDFIVEPGAKPKAIKLGIEGARGLALDRHGNLVMHTSGGDLIQEAPVAYQEINGVRHAVASRFVLKDNQVGFKVGKYDHSLPLVIDPVVNYATYMPQPVTGMAVDGAGSVFMSSRTGMVAKLNPTGTALIYQTYLGSQTTDIAIDSAGNAYVLGEGTVSTTANAYSQTPDQSFLTVLDSTGANFLYSTYLPLDFGDVLNSYYYVGGVAVDGSGNAYVTGLAPSGLDFGTTAYQATSVNGGMSLMKINPQLSGTASLVYGTYLGGTATNGSGTPQDIVVDGTGKAYVVGTTSSASFPTTAGALETSIRGSNDVFVAKFDTAQSGAASLAYSTYLGGSDNDGSAFTGFWTGKSKSGIAWGPKAPAIAVDAGGSAYVTGYTHSSDFPVTSGAFKTNSGINMSGTGSNYTPGVAFVTKLNAAGTALAYSTFLGTSSKNIGTQMIGTAITVDSAGNAYLGGQTGNNLPITNNAFQKTHKPNYDAYVAKLNAAGSSLLFGSYLGGSGTDSPFGIGRDSAGNLYVGGITGAYQDFPTTSGSFMPTSSFGLWYGFAAKISGV
jgi:hypothetical protein